MDRIHAQETMMRVTVHLKLQEWRVIAEVLDQLVRADTPNVRPGLADEIRASVAQYELYRWTDAGLDLTPSDAAVVRSITAELPQREVDRTVDDIERALG